MHWNQNLNELMKNVPYWSTAFSLFGLSGAAVLTYVIKDLPHAIWKGFLKQITTSVEVTSQETEFTALAQWIETGGFSKRFRSLRPRNGKLSVGFGRHFFLYRKRLCWLYRYRVENKASYHDLEEMHLFCIGRRQTFLRTLITQAMSDFRKSDETRIYYSGQESWSLSTKQPRKTFDSMLLSTENRMKVAAHLETFFKSKEWYRSNGIPYRTGICLYGPPGTGKTSFVRAVCGQYELDLHVLEITNTNDQKIKEMIWTVGPRSVLLIEDIDTISASRTRAGNKITETDPLNAVTLGGLLNAIDGVVESDGRLLILTTNHIEYIDPALLRAGRIDLKIPLGLMTRELYQAAFQRFFPQFHLPGEVIWRDDIAPAEFQKILLENRQDPMSTLNQTTKQPHQGNTHSFDPLVEIPLSERRHFSTKDLLIPVPRANDVPIHSS